MLSTCCGFLVSLIVAVTPASPVMHAEQAPTIPRHTVSGRLLALGWPGVDGIEAASEFRYVGGQRFVLRGTVDVEQHAFVIAGSGGTVSRLLWVQVEHFLPASAGSYDYSADSAVSLRGRSFRFNARQFTSPPDPASDRGALYALLKRSGHSMPDSAARIRWVQVTPDGRSELMIIHAQAGPARGASPSTLAATAQGAFALLPQRDR